MCFLKQMVSMTMNGQVDDAPTVIAPARAHMVLKFTPIDVGKDLHLKTSTVPAPNTKRDRFNSKQLKKWTAEGAHGLVAAAMAVMTGGVWTSAREPHMKMRSTDIGSAHATLRSGTLRWTTRSSSEMRP